MLINQDEQIIVGTVKELQEASALVGLTQEDIISLLAAGLEIADLLQYAHTLLSNRMN